MNYAWNVVQMERLTSDGFVVTVHYTVNAVDGKYNASIYGAVSYIQEDKAYIPYAELTENQVIGWVQESLGKNKVEEDLAEQIEAQKNPVEETGLPWVNV